MSTKMFMPIKFNTTIILTPKELNKNFDNTIVTKVKETLENNCTKHGFIKKDSIKIIKRSAGYCKESHLNGNVAFDLSCIAEICNPVQDSIIKCIVKAKNNLGIRAVGQYENLSILEVIIPRITSGIQSEIDIDTINIGDNINVKVCGKKFTLYDKMISIVGKIIKDKEDILEVEEEIQEDKSDVDDLEDDINDDGIEILEDDEEELGDDDEEENSVKKIKIDKEESEESEDSDNSDELEESDIDGEDDIMSDNEAIEDFEEF